MPRRAARANARKSAVRSALEHVFARQKGPMGLFSRITAGPYTYNLGFPGQHYGAETGIIPFD